jgi:putative flippase GtrA
MEIDINDSTESIPGEGPRADEKPHSAFRPSDSLRVQFRRSLICSAIGFGSDALILFFLVSVPKFHYLVSNAASFVIGSTIVYALNSSWVFPPSIKRKRFLRYGLFLIMAATGLFFNSILMLAFVSGLGLWYMAAKVVSAAIVFMYNFACRKLVVFGDKERNVGKALVFKGRNVAICAAAFVVLLILVEGPWIGAGAVAQAAPGATLPDMRFFYAPSELAPLFAALGEAGRGAYLRMDLVDFFFAAAYGLLFLVGIGWEASRLFPRLPALRALGLIGAFGALADETENIVFRGIASGGTDGLARIASIATPIKFVCVYACLPLLVLGLAAVIVKAIAARLWRNESP